jgi:CHAT domain-containing protein
LRKRRAQARDGKIAIPSGLARDIRRAEQLEAQIERNPGASVPLIQVYKQIIERLRPEKTPDLYAAIQSNLGAAYCELPTGNRGHNLELALECYQQALRFCTPETEPYRYRKTIRNLANLYFAQGIWNEALGAYRVAMGIGEQLYRAGLSTTSKTGEVSESSALYPDAAFAAVRCGEPTEALLILEQGKTRLLTEALRLRIRRPPHVPDAIWHAFEQAAATMRTLQTEKLYTDTERTERHDPVQAYEMRVRARRAANAALDAAIADVRAYAPHFLAPQDRSTLEAWLPDTQAAFIAFCITEQGSMGFAVSRHAQERVQVIEVPTFTQSDLDDLFGEWLGAYNRFFSDRKNAALEAALQETITRVLAELGERLLTPIVSVLSADVEHIIFLPSEELFQFPLHAIPLAGPNSELICDRYQVSYAPSIEVLTDARAKTMQEVTPELYAVINPEDDPKLLFTPFEGMAIAQLFDESTVDGGQGGTKGRVLAGMQGRTYVHFSCHGNYQWNDPPASGLHLADDRLTLADLQQGGVDLSATRVVTLSACETGITDLFPGRAGEYVGIPAGFLLAGAACVISSLWAVDDLSTALLMERFYRNHLINKMALAAALQEAQVWLRELSIGEVAAYAAQWYRQSTQKEEEKKKLLRFTLHYRYLAEQNPTLRPFAHPYYWAAFTVNGW